MAACPHCHAPLNCQGLSGRVECPHCGKPFLYRPGRKATPGQHAPADFLAVPADEEESVVEEAEPLAFLEGPAPTAPSGAVPRISRESPSGEGPGVFDFGFQKFVTPTVVKVIWFIAVALFFLNLALTVVGLLGVYSDPTVQWCVKVFGVFYLPLVLLFSGLALLVVRVFLESTMVFFRMARHAKSMERTLSGIACKFNQPLDGRQADVRDDGGGRVGGE